MVVDTSALLAVIFEEPECARFAELFATSETNLCSAVSALEAGISPVGHLCLLGALLLLTLAGAPFATAAALRISL